MANPSEKPARKPRRWLRRLLQALLATVVAFVVLALGVQTPFAKGRIARFIEGRVSTAIVEKIEIGEVTGTVPFDLRVAEITLWDEGAPWLVVQDVAVDIGAAALLRRQVHVRSATATTVELRALPVGEERAEPWRIPEIPELPRFLRIDRAEVDRLIVSEEVAAEAGEFTARAHYIPGARDIDVEAQVERTDAPTTRAHVVLQLADDTLKVDADVSDSVFLPELLGVDEPVALTVKGLGPTRAWDGTLEARLGERALAAATATLRAEAVTKFEARGAMNLLTPLFTDAMRDQLGDELRFTVDGSLTEAGLLTLTAARVDSIPASIELAGAAHLQERTLTGNVSIAHENLRAFVTLEGTEPLPLDLRAELDGTWSALTWALDADVAGERNAVLEGTASIEEVLALSVTGEVRVPKVLVAEAQQELTDEPLRVVVVASYDQNNGVLAVPEFSVGNEWASVSGSVQADPSDNTIQALAQARLIDSTLLNEVLVPDIDGIGTAELRVTGNEAGTSIALDAQIADFRLDTVRVPQIAVRADVRGGAWPDDLLEGIAANVQASTGAVYAEDLELPPVRLAVNAEQEQGGPVRVSTIELTDERFMLAGRGTIAEALDAAEFTFELKVPELEPYTALFDLPYGGAMDASSEASYEQARTDPWQGSVRATLQAPRAWPSAIQELLSAETRLVAEIGYGSERFSVARFSLDNESSGLGVVGAYSTASGTFDASATLTLVDALVAGTTSSGTIVFAANGTFEDFETNAEINLSKVEAGSVSMDALTGAVLASGALDDLEVSTELTARAAGEELNASAIARIAADDITVPELQVRSGANRIDGRAAWNLEAQRGDGALVLNLPELDQIGRVVGQELRGTLTGDVVLASLQDDSTLDLDLSLEQFGSAYATVDKAAIEGSVRRLFAEPTGVVDARIETLTASAFQAQSTGILARFGGNSVEFESESNGVAANSIPFDASLAGAWRLDESAGSLTSFEGSLDTYAFALREGARMQFKDNGFVFQPVLVGFETGTIRARASVIEDALEADVELDALPLAAGRLVGLPFSAGTVAGKLELRGTPDRPTGTAVIDIASAQTPIMVEQRGLYADIHMESQLAPGSLTASATLTVPQNGEASLQLTLPLSASEDTVYAVSMEDSLSGVLMCNLNLAVVPRLLALERHLLNGNATANFTFAGTPGDPRLDGNVVVASGEYENAEFGTFLKNASVEIRAIDDRLELTRFDAVDPTGGTVSAEGALVVSSLSEFHYDAAMLFGNARLVHRDDVSGHIEGKLALSGDQDSGRISGALTVVESSIILRPAPDQSIPALEVQYANVPAAFAESEEDTVTGFLKRYPIALDVSVRIPGRTFVRAPDVVTEWDGDLRITGTADAPLIAGRISPVRGHISFLGRRFILQPESTVNVDTEASPVPLLNLVAVTTRNDVTATLFLRGPLDELQLEMTSEPPLPREEILSRVLFGRNMSEISPVQALQLARAIAMFTGTLEGVPFFSGPSRLPVIDTFDVERDEEEGTTVSVGKYVSEDIFVELEQGTGVGTSRANVEFEVTPHVSVESSVGANAEGGLGIFWKYDY